jgi:hypothetical protein
VSKGDGTASGVHVLDTETEDLGVRFYDGGKGFVKFPYGDIGLGKSRLFEKLLDYGGGRDWEVYGI